MTAIADEIDAIAAAEGFSGVVSVSRGLDVVFERAYGLADRAHGIANTVDTQFGIASGTKGFTALTVAALIEDGQLTLSTTARSVLGSDLPLIADDVTVEHLLEHTSGIGDFADEEAEVDDSDYVLRVPVHTLGETEGYVAALDGFPTKFAAGERFSYCNGGYVVLALIAERVAGAPFRDLVEVRVWRPAGMTRTGFLRMDDLPGSAATGYLPDGRANVLHLPVRGSGDGGAFSTAADVRTFWLALFAGRIIAEDRVAEIVLPRSEVPDESMRYGRGFWLAEAGPVVMLVGGDAGVSFRSAHDPTTGLTRTILSNTDGRTGLVNQRVAELYT
jgi:CubicO group peptidase (beta-lactamase class C family)